MKVGASITALGVVVLLGCVSSSTVGYVDESAIPVDYVGRSHRTWAVGNEIFVEVEQIPGFNVADITFEIREGSIYLTPVRVSSGGSGRRTFQIKIPTKGLGSSWMDRVYWLTREGYYPITARGYWRRGDRAPSGRVRVQFSLSGSGAQLRPAEGWPSNNAIQLSGS